MAVIELIILSLSNDILYFHSGLRDEDIPEDCPFVCSDCFNRVHRCFKCKHFDVEEDLVKCSVPYCGKFYHTKVFIYFFGYFFIMFPGRLS